MKKLVINASKFLDLASGTRAGKGAEREELGAVLLPGIDSTGVVLVVSEAACVAVRACATVSARFHQVEATLEKGPLCGAKI